MSAAVAFIVAIVGVGLLVRGVVDYGIGFLCVAVALAAWWMATTPLRKIEVAVATALTLAGAVQGHWIEGLWAAAIVVSALELMRVFR
jgi:hypothetical protein